MEKYISNLKVFIENDFNYTMVDNVLNVREDNEISYVFNLQKRKIYIKERGSLTEIQTFSDDRFLRLEFAFTLLGAFNKSSYYKEMDVFSKTIDLEELRKITREKFEEKYYSIGQIEDNKISLTVDKSYKIIFRYKGVDYVIHDDSNREYIFKNFYWEVSNISSLEYDINRYMNIFNETFTTDEIMRFWGYSIGIR